MMKPKLVPLAVVSVRAYVISRADELLTGRLPEGTKRTILLALVVWAAVLASGAHAQIRKPTDFLVGPDYLSDQPTNQPAEPGGGKSDEELAKLTQNPVANLISVPFQNNFYFGIGPKNGTQWTLNVQPVIPFSLNEDWLLITRTIVPITYQESFADGLPYAFGLGDVNPTFFFAPAKPSKFIWGVGPTFTFPTGTEPQLTSGKWSAGPAAVGLYMDGPWVIGALMNQQWSFAGWGKKDTSGLLIQPFVNYNLEHGWYLTSGPIMTANWKAGGANVWTVPLGGGIGRIVRFGKLPVNLSLQAYYNVVTPRDFGSDWQLRFQIQFLFPR